MNGSIHPTDQPLAPEDADRIVAEAARTYFDECRARIPKFVDANFSVMGSARLHRHALGWDLLRAPANVMLSLPQVGLKLGAVAARALGRSKTADSLERRHLFFQTAVARELRWRMMSDLLRQPFEDGDRSFVEDGLAEAILSNPEITARVQAAGEVAAAHSEDPDFRSKLEAALTEYAGTRAAASEITTGLIALGGGAVAFNQVTPGAFALGPAIAASFAQSAAVSSFPLGTTAGGLWYGLFPVKASPLLVAGATAGVMGVAALASAFAGVLADPVQRALGLHERRLLKLVDALEAALKKEGAAGFVAYDLYVARLMDLSDVLLSVTRAFRHG
jgi:hypothetical protein